MELIANQDYQALIGQIVDTGCDGYQYLFGRNRLKNRVIHCGVRAKVAVKNCVFVIRKLLIINSYYKYCFLKELDYQAVIYSRHTFFYSTFFYLFI